MVAIHRNVIILPGLERRDPGVLLLEESSDRLERILFRVPFDTYVVDGLFGEVLKQLGAQRAGDCVVQVVLMKSLTQHNDRIVILYFSILNRLLETLFRIPHSAQS
jgi:hypothetical protein